MTECQRLFKNEIWNCSLGNKNVYQQLPIFVKTTLPHGKLLNILLGFKRNLGHASTKTANVVPDNRQSDHDQFYQILLEMLKPGTKFLNKETFGKKPWQNLTYLKYNLSNANLSTNALVYRDKKPSKVQLTDHSLSYKEEEVRIPKRN